MRSHWAAQRAGPSYRCGASFPSAATPVATHASPSYCRTGSSRWRTSHCGSTVKLQRLLLACSPNPNPNSSSSPNPRPHPRPHPSPQPAPHPSQASSSCASHLTRPCAASCSSHTRTWQRCATSAATPSRRSTRGSSTCYASQARPPPSGRRAPRQRRSGAATRPSRPRRAVAGPRARR